MVECPEIRRDYAGFRMPFPKRMTIIRLADGGLWIHSPTTDDERVFAAVAALGPVRHLIAPNTIHYWWVPDWYRRFPDATVHRSEERRVGTSVSGRVDLGGRRIIKKKKKKHVRVEH